MPQGLSVDDLMQRVVALARPEVAAEAGVIALSLLLAWLLVRWLRGPQPHPGSIWFGEGVAGGVLFPALALALMFAGAAALASLASQSEWSLQLMHLALPLLSSVLVIRLMVRVLRLAFPRSGAMRSVERSLAWVAWIAAALWITGALPHLLAELDAMSWRIGSMHVSLRNVIEGAVTAIVVLVLALWLSAALEARLLAGATSNLSVRKMAANTLRAVLLFIGLMFALSAAGIDLTALGVLGGALGVGIGFGLQKLAANYISGFVILAERAMRIGDLVKVDNFEGRITDISTRYTVIRALNGREAIVPNEMMITQRVENASLADRNVLVSTSVLVAYGSDLDALTPQLVAAIAAVPRVLAEPAPSVQLSAFAADGLELTLPFWIGDPENGTGNVRSDVNLAILRTLGAAGIEIPFPQRMLLQRAP